MPTKRKKNKKSLQDFAAKLNERATRVNILQEIKDGRGHAALKTIAEKRRNKK